MALMICGWKGNHGPGGNNNRYVATWHKTFSDWLLMLSSFKRRMKTEFFMIRSNHTTPVMPTADAPRIQLIVNMARFTDVCVIIIIIIIIINFSPSVVKLPRVKSSKKVKIRSWSCYASESSWDSWATKESRNRTELKRCMVTAIRYYNIIIIIIIIF